MRKYVLTLMMICAVCVSAQDYAETRGFKAIMNGKIAVEVFFQTDLHDDEWLMAGYIYYPNAKAPAPILIVNNWGDEKPSGSDDDYTFECRFVEYQPNGEVTGILYLTCAEVEGDFQMIKASWKNPTTGRVLKLTDFEETRELPEWWPGKPALFSAPKREDWKFLYKLADKYDDTGDSEWMNTIYVTFMANDKELLSFEEPLNGAVSSEMEEKLDWIIEKDINFDGIPDVLVYLGLTRQAQTLYKAYVWNPVTRQFYEVKEFQEIEEPDFDSKAETITSTARDGTTLYIDKYQWKNGKLTKINSKKETIN